MSNKFTLKLKRGWWGYSSFTPRLSTVQTCFCHLPLLRGLLLIEASVGAFCLFGIQPETPSVSLSCSLTAWTLWMSLITEQIICSFAVIRPPIYEGCADQLRTGFISVVQELMLFKRLYFNDSSGSVVPLENKGSVTRAHFTHGEQTRWRLFEAP